MIKQQILIALFFFVFVTGCVSSAFHSGKHRPQRAPASSEFAQETLEERYTFLEEGTSEEPGYGLYSYVLFKVRPTESNKNLYLEIISHILRRSNELDEKKDQHFLKKELNVTYFLVTSKPQKNTFKGTDKGTDEHIANLSNWILEHYDYRRASNIMREMGLSSDTGPFILSSFKPPLSTNEGPSKHLLQNFTHVPSNRENLVQAWVNTFFQHANTPKRWDSFSLAQLGLDLRTHIAIAASQIPLIKKELQEWVKLIESVTS